MNALKKFISHHVVLFILLVGVLFALVGAVASFKGRQAAIGSDQTPDIPKVEMEDVSSFSKGSGDISVGGIVESMEQVDIRSLVASPVESVKVKIGDTVSEGQTIVTLKNADISATLAQAKAGYSAAAARLAEIKAGARPEDLAIARLDAQKAQSDLGVLYSQAATSLADAAGKIDGILRVQISDMFINGDSEEARLSFTVSNASDAELRAKVGRIQAGVNLKDFFDAINAFREAPDAAGVDGAFAKGDAVLGNVRATLDALMISLQNAPQLSPATATSYKTLVNAARSSATAAATAITTQKQSILAQNALIVRTHNLLRIKEEGATQEQILAAQSAVDQAAAAVAAASAAYDKTILKAPISGKISSVSLRVGDLATLGGPIATIINTRGLKVRAFVSASDVQSLRIGDSVSLASGTAATVGMISPGIDPVTKKAEITILIPDANSKNVVVGQYIEGKISPASALQPASSYLLPLTAIKVAEGKYSVYTVEGGRVKEIPVTAGAVQGEQVQITGGLTEGMKIISAIRQLRPGDEVITE